MFWLDFDAWKDHCVIPVHFTVTTGLANARSYTLSFYHALTGCDTPQNLLVEEKRLHGTLGT